MEAKYPDYLVMVYDCSFVQDYVPWRERLFDSREAAMTYGESLMKDYAASAQFEFSPELLVHVGMGLYQTIGYWEFDCAHTDMDLFDMVASLDDYDELGNFTYHDMF